MSVVVPFDARRTRREVLAISCRPLEETRTPQNACHWLASCEIDDRLFEARSRRDAPKELARALVAAGIDDRAMVITYQGLRGSTRYPSFHAIAGWTTVESASTPVRNGRFERMEDDAFPEPSERPGSVTASGGKMAYTPSEVSLEGAEAEGSKSRKIGAGPETPTEQPKNGLHCCSAPGCSNRFVSTRQWARFCSPACEQKARRARRAHLAEAPAE